MSETKRKAANPFAISCPVGGSIISLVESHSKAVAEHLRSIGLYRGQEMILKVLAETGGCSQNELKNRLCLDHSTVAKSVGRMEKSGFLTREKSPSDRRITIVKITAEGEKRLEASEEIWNGMEKQALNGLTETDIQEFLRISAQITENLSTSLKP
ncbi:transcriptional regulator [Listeria floridensis FSL S10-1187]|uniref:Transcriptional regulator n=1 Tax=Listeria floridensis FSL S10-1187 TaxID=1265817 RepID=A0ABN0RHS5_9LIST|nr:MarR family transcriptional regulator [Listeria floridensis]EUJ33422.1 transcriptional regulator [Listeria floridensis FSL S10-1187]